MPHRSSFAYTPQNSRPDALSALDPSANIDININTTYSIEPAPHRKPTFFTLCTALVYILILLAMCASFPLILIFTPQPELGEWSPGGIVCASCAEVEGMGVAEEALDVLGCRGWESTVNPENLRNVTFGGMRACWVEGRLGKMVGEDGGVEV